MSYNGECVFSDSQVHTSANESDSNSDIGNRRRHSTHLKMRKRPSLRTSAIPIRRRDSGNMSPRASRSRIVVSSPRNAHAMRSPRSTHSEKVDTFLNPAFGTFDATCSGSDNESGTSEFDTSVNRSVSKRIGSYSGSVQQLASMGHMRPPVAGAQSDGSSRDMPTATRNASGCANYTEMLLKDAADVRNRKRNDRLLILTIQKGFNGLVGLEVNGSLVVSVSPDGPAHAAGVVPGYRLMTINFERIPESCKEDTEYIKSALRNAPEHFMIKVDKATTGGESVKGLVPMTRRVQQELVARLVLTAFYFEKSPKCYANLNALVAFISKGTHSLSELIQAVCTKYKVDATEANDWQQGNNSINVACFVIKRFARSAGIEVDAAGQLEMHMENGRVLEARTKALHVLCKQHDVPYRKWSDDVPQALHPLLQPSRGLVPAVAAALAIAARATWQPKPAACRPASPAPEPLPFAGAMSSSLRASIGGGGGHGPDLVENDSGLLIQQSCFSGRSRQGLSASLERSGRSSLDCNFPSAARSPVACDGSAPVMSPRGKKTGEASIDPLAARFEYSTESGKTTPASRDEARAEEPASAVRKDSGTVGFFRRTSLFALPRLDLTKARFGRGREKLACPSEGSCGLSPRNGRSSEPASKELPPTSPPHAGRHSGVALRGSSFARGCSSEGGGGLMALHESASECSEGAGDMPPADLLDNSGKSAELMAHRRRSADRRGFRMNRQLAPPAVEVSLLSSRSSTASELSPRSRTGGALRSTPSGQTASFVGSPGPGGGPVVPGFAEQQLQLQLQQQPVAAPAAARKKTRRDRHSARSQAVDRSDNDSTGPDEVHGTGRRLRRRAPTVFTGDSIEDKVVWLEERLQESQGDVTFMVTALEKAERTKEQAVLEAETLRKMVKKLQSGRRNSANELKKIRGKLRCSEEDLIRTVEQNAKNLNAMSEECSPLTSAHDSEFARGCSASVCGSAFSPGSGDFCLQQKMRDLENLVRDNEARHTDELSKAVVESDRLRAMIKAMQQQKRRGGSMGLAADEKTDADDELAQRMREDQEASLVQQQRERENLIELKMRYAWAVHILDRLGLGSYISEDYSRLDDIPDTLVGSARRAMAALAAQPGLKESTLPFDLR
ncbi:hypothetical protein DIPPA_29504 [Diplonema papillatum]|nr:hypothetical protein DIPPA_29504 [Diplonema papillatum]